MNNPVKLTMIDFIFACIYVGSAIAGCFQMYDYLLGLLFTEKPWTFYGLCTILTALTIMRCFELEEI